MCRVDEIHNKKLEKMTIAEITEIENNRKSKEQYGVIHLLNESNFYRAHDWSAWLMTMFPTGEAVNSPLKVSAKKLKDGYIEAWVGFPVSSLEKYVPNDGSVQFQPVSDTQIDVVVKLTDDLMETDFESFRKLVDDWKGTLPLNDGKKQRREEREVSEAEPRIMRISDVLGQLLSFPLESKSPMEAWEFLRVIRQKIVAMY